MNERIHAFLDGDLPAEALSDAERAQAHALEAVLARATARVRGAPAPDLTARVMAALPAAAPRRAGWRTALEWLLAPRPLRLSLRPAYGLAVAGLAAAALLVVPAVTPEPPQQVVAAAPTAGQPVVYVQFRLEAGTARQVSLAGSFTGWQPTVTLEQTAPGVWTTLVPLQPGVHDYVFVIDGTRWMPDPHAPQQVDDDFGGTNSRISLPPPTVRA